MSEAALIEEHRPLARKIASRYYLAGGDHDDLEQEALIGLWKATRDFNGEGSFRRFAALCMERQVITALKTSRRAKHLPLTHALRTVQNDEGETLDAVDLVLDWTADPSEIIPAREEAFRLLRVVRDELSDHERRILIAFVNGKTYREIAEELGLAMRPRITTWRGKEYVTESYSKTVDSTLARARKKLADPFQERRAA